MKVLALHNVKGGVGKTAAAVNLAYLAAEDGYRTLLWDLDPQGASTFYLRVKPKVKGGAGKLVRGERTALDSIKESDFENLDVLPADLSFRHMDLELDDAGKPKRRIREILKSLDQEYDLIVLDCPPGITLFTEAVLSQSDAVAVPLVPTTLSVRTYEQLVEFLRDRKLKKLRLMPFLSMVDRRKRIHTEISDALIKGLPHLLSAAIPYSSDIEKMGIEREPVAVKNCRGGDAFRALWQEIIQAL